MWGETDCDVFSALVGFAMLLFISYHMVHFQFYAGNQVLPTGPGSRRGGHR